MKKVVIALAMLVGVSYAHSEIKPTSHGEYKVEYVGGMTDMYVKLNYQTDGKYYAFALKCANRYNPNVFSLVLGTSPEEAVRSIDALIGILDNGKKNEIYTLDDATTVCRKSKNLMYVHRVGYSDSGYIERRHLNNAREFVSMAILK